MKRFLVLLVVVAALVAAAAFAMPSQAVTVNGQAISQQAVDADLSAIAGSSGYQCYLDATLVLEGDHATGIFPVTGAGSAKSTTGSQTPAAYNTTFVRYWLTQMTSDLLVSQEVRDRHLTVTAADVALGRAGLRQEVTAVLEDFEEDTGAACASSAAALLDSLPAGFRSEQVRAQTERDVLDAHLAGYGLGTSSLERFYTLHRAEFDTVCLSYVSFGSQSDADAAEAAVAAGTPLSQTGTETKLGCGIQKAITELPSSVTSLAVGKVSSPVAEGTSTGRYALLTVTSRRVSVFTVARTTVAQALLAAGSARTTALLDRANRRADVTADPRYGRVRPKTVTLAAPPSPPSGVVLNPTANLPSTAASGSSARSSRSGSG